MDPDATLEIMRELAKDARCAFDVRAAERELRWRFEELDEWLAKGGFLPTDWNALR